MPLPTPRNLLVLLGVYSAALCVIAAGVAVLIVGFSGVGALTIALPYLAVAWTAIVGCSAIVFLVVTALQRSGYDAAATACLIAYAGLPLLAFALL